MRCQSNKAEKGFTFIELTVVIAIIGVLAAIAIPNFNSYQDRAYHADARIQCIGLRQTIEEYYGWHGSFPRDNQQAGLPEPEQMATNYLSSITVENGALHMVWGNKAAQAWHGKTTTIQPWVSQTGSNEVIIWGTGSSKRDFPLENKKLFKPYGTNQTNLEI